MSKTISSVSADGLKAGGLTDADLMRIQSSEKEVFQSKNGLKGAMKDAKFKDLLKK